MLAPPPLKEEAEFTAPITQGTIQSIILTAALKSLNQNVKSPYSLIIRFASMGGSSWLAGL